MVPLIAAGRALRIRDRRMGTHLWFVLTSPDPDSGLVILVAVVTERGHTDRTVRLEVGDHPFIRHPSNVDYGTAKFAPAGRLTEALSTGKADLDLDASTVLLGRLCEGLLTSSRTPNVVAAALRNGRAP
ncbi:hypothetical protein [Gemmatimonas sp.]|uniref:hypothetical protein n=1 Tax=Gemmatimonas sp. TaxID=1962908 RepID=UPI00334271A5